MMKRIFNQGLSVDCVVFGFDGTSIKVLLVERKGLVGRDMKAEYKLPGSLIYQDEDLPTAANRVLSEMTGLNHVYLKMFSVFSDPHRVDSRELEWLNDFYGVKTERVVTAAYQALIRIDSKISMHTKYRSIMWHDVHEIRHLALDHKQIVMEGLSTLRREVSQLPVALELLPKKFTMRQLQNLYEAVLGEEIDNRNFRKKILDSRYMIATDEKENGVAHKPATYYRFDSAAYNKDVKRRPILKFM